MHSSNKKDEELKTAKLFVIFVYNFFFVLSFLNKKNLFHIHLFKRNNCNTTRNRYKRLIIITLRFCKSVTLTNPVTKVKERE